VLALSPTPSPADDEHKNPVRLWRFLRRTVSSGVLWHSRAVVSYLSPMVDNVLRSEMEQRLRRCFGQRFRAAVFYGSRALGREGPGSDLDLLVVLDGPIRLWADTHRAVVSLYDVQLGLDYPIHVIPVEKDSYDAGEYSLYRHAKIEASVA